MSRRPEYSGVKDARTIELTPLENRFAARMVYDLFVEAAAKWGEEPALIWLPNGRASDDAQIWSFGALLAAINRTANLFDSLAKDQRSMVAYLLPNLPEAHFVLWGGATAGQVIPINPLLTPPQIAEIMHAAGAKILVVAAPDIDLEIWEKVAVVQANLVDPIDVLVVGETTPDGTLNFRHEVEKHRSDGIVNPRAIQPDDISTCFHTGGTTGTPKIAQQTHWNQVSMSWIMGYVADCAPGDRFLTALPLFHANAAIFSGLTAFSNGMSTVIAGKTGFRSKEMAADFWKLVERFGITHFSAVPTILASLLDIPVEGAKINSLRICACGAAPLPVSLFRKFETETGVRILEGYGMTEGTLASAINPRDGERKIGSVGTRLPYLGLRTVILDGDGHFVRDCKIDEIGAILISGDTVIPGYRQPALNSDVWALPGWFNSGDLGRLDKDGYLWLTGRAKDLIIRGGHNIDPAVIEEALQRHPAVELAAAVGKPDAYAGEVPVAFVRLRPGESVSEQELLEHARANVPERPAAPHFVRIIETMPLTAVGKIFKPTLREFVAKEVVAEKVAGFRGVIDISASTLERRGLVVEVTVDAAFDREKVERLLADLPLQIDIRGNAHVHP